jgi:hypothetical protein
MVAPIQILAVKQDGDDGLVVTFSDGTAAGYVVEELLKLRPKREPAAPLELANADGASRVRL